MTTGVAVRAAVGGERSATVTSNGFEIPVTADHDPVPVARSVTPSFVGSRFVQSIASDPVHTPPPKALVVVPAPQPDGQESVAPAALGGCGTARVRSAAPSKPVARFP